MRRFCDPWLKSRKSFNFNGGEKSNDVKIKNQSENAENAEFQENRCSDQEDQNQYGDRNQRSGLGQTKVGSNGGQECDHQRLEQCVTTEKKPDPIWNKINKAIKYHRFILGASQKECAESIHMSAASWSRYESGQFPDPPTIRQMKVIEKIADMFGLKYTDMLKDYPSTVDGINYKKSRIYKSKIISTVR